VYLTSPAPILVAEDSIADFTALRRAFGKHGVPNPLVHCADGEQALDYLYGHGQGLHQAIALPALVLLDLNMPGLNGRDVLEVLKGDPVLQVIPVIIFTGSDKEHDLAECYRLGANSYLVKPPTYGELEQKVGVLARYWLQATALPHFC
jgi:CheY-like chemotaxis protein